MTGLLISHRFNTTFGKDFAAAFQNEDIELELLVLPPSPEARIDDALAARAEAAYYSNDMFPEFGRQFFSALQKAPGLQWMQVFNAGVDHPVFASMLKRGVRLTTSSGTAAEPLAQAAIGGMLYLARNFPRWLANQRNHVWDRSRKTEDLPRDLRGQVMLVFGLGKIGEHIARLARAFGLHVIGVRRTAVKTEHVDEMHTPEELIQLLPRCDWLVLACPLNDETRGLVNAELLARLPRGARLINIGRGEVIDEPALIEALQSGQLAGAYLDVFAKEPLPAESPLWDLPNVLITAHNAAASSGNDARVNALFFDNLKRLVRHEPLINEVTKL